MKIILILLAAIMFFENEMPAQDWPNLNKYKAANDTLNNNGNGKNRVVFMGDSITEFWLIEHPEFFSGKPYINRGISGQTTPQMLVRFRQDVIHLNPKVVVILAGINDIAGNTGPSTLEMIEDNIASMCEIAIANKIKVVLCSLLPAGDFPWNPGIKPAEKVTELNKWLRSYANKNKIVYLDYYSALADKNKGLPVEYSEDGVHPNKKCYQVMAPLAEDAITKALKN